MKRAHVLRLASLALLATLSFHFTLDAAFATAQDPATGRIGSSGREHEQAFQRKQRRLNITGWTLIGAGAAFPLIAVPIQEVRSRDRLDCDLAACADNIAAVTSLVMGPVMIVTGGALLWKRRSLRKSHRADAQFALYPGPTGIAMAGTF